MLWNAHSELLGTLFYNMIQKNAISIYFTQCSIRYFVISVNKFIATNTINCLH